MSRARGFTLLELLVAVFIAALMAAMGYAAIGQVTRQRGSVQAEQRSIDALSRTMRVMTLDFAQTAARPVRDALGRGMDSAVLADPRVSQGISLTRASGAPVLGAARPALQRVSWALEGEELVRIAWAAPDRTQTTPERRRVMLTGVRRLQFRFLAPTGEWRAEWPGELDADAGPASGRMRPRAVEVTIEDARLGVVRRIIEVGG
jgi:general secretion pathway protein J